MKNNETFEGTVKSSLFDSLEDKFLCKFLIDTQPTEKKREEARQMIDIYKKYGLSVTEMCAISAELANMQEELKLKYDYAEDIEH